MDWFWFFRVIWGAGPSVDYQGVYGCPGVENWLP